METDGKNVFGTVIFSVVAVGMTLFSCLSIHFSTIVSILLCGCIGVMGYLIEKYRKGRGQS